MMEGAGEPPQARPIPGSLLSRRILRGPLGLEIARFGAPLALGMGLQTTFNLVDAYIIARLDAEVAGPALGAIGICDQLAAVGTILSYGLSVAAAALVSRKQGEGDDSGVRRIAWQSLLVVLGLSALFGVVALLGARTLMFDVVGAKGQVAELGTRYLRVMVGGSFTIFLLLHLTTLQRALGSSKTPISILVGANVVNLLLAVLLVYGPGPAPPVFAWGPPVAEALGIPRLELLGAAWATVIARSLALAPTAYILIKRFKLFTAESRSAPDPAVIQSLWYIGWPTSIQLVVRIVAMLITHSLVARAYTTATDQSATTALGIVFRLETMALFIGLGWGSAAQTFMGQNLGAGAQERAKRSGWYATAYNALMMAALASAYRIWAGPVVAFFDDEPRVMTIAVDYVEWVAPSYVGLGIGIVLGCAIQGAGAARLPLWLDIAVIIAVQLPLSLLVVVVLDVGVTHLWQVMALTYAAYAVVYALGYRRGGYLLTVLR